MLSAPMQDHAGSYPVEEARSPSRLIRRHSAWTRLTHWVWAVSLFFLLLSGLQIFNAHPTLYVGDQSGFQFENAVLRIGAVRGPDGARGFTEFAGIRFDTTGVLGVSGAGEGAQARAFPAWATIPSGQDLATGRVVHFFFAWVLVFTLFVWFAASLLNRHLRRDIIPRVSDLKGLPADISSHARMQFRHEKSYGPLQKLAYAGVLLVALPLMVLSGLAMSPGFNAFAPFLADVLGGRQTARTIHFAVMALLVMFFVVHIVMVVAAGPVNELRSIITGWYRVDAESGRGKGER